MVQLNILARGEPTEVVVSEFPLSLGRAGFDTVCIEDQGVWERHVEIAFDRASGFSFTANPAAILFVNGEKVETGVLRNGDLLQLGNAQVRFWLTRTHQKSLRPREVLTWTAFGLLFAAQFALIWFLLQ